MSDALQVVNDAMEAALVPNGAGDTTPKPRRMSDIKIKIKRTPREIEIDMDKLTWKDAKDLRKRQVAIQDGTMSEEEALAVSDDLIHKVTGLDPDSLPYEVAQRVMEVLYAEDADAAAAEGNSETA